ncbi:MAG: type II toxin-antitoxin system VapC family toxin [Chloroflexi bacterium]|nr:type II toxin-antitoxin system VapC family toxin [Chloroflexota bacterium]
MRILLDTNIILEILLEQEKAKEVKALFDRLDQHETFLSAFSLYSIGLVFFRRKRHEVFRGFLNDLLLNGGVEVFSLLPEDMETVITTAQKFNLDFDDAYQYVVAEKHDLILISFDHDFDRTGRGRKTPAQIL